VHDETKAAIAIFGRDDDHAGLAKAWRLRFGVQANADRYAQALDAAEQVVEQARLASDGRLAARGATGYALAALCGPMPVPEAIARCERLAQEAAEDRRTEGIIRCFLGQLYAMNGEFERGREAYELARRTLEELGRSVLAASTSINSWRVEILAGNPARATEELRRDYAALEGMGEKYLLSTVAGSLGQALYVLDDLDGAERYSRVAEDLAGEDDVESQALWRCVRAKVMARRSETEPAEALVRQALEIVRPTEAPIILTDTLLDLAAVLRLSGRARESGPPLEEALTIYEAKKDIVSVERVRSLLEEVLGSTSTAG
jgi:tetratricopeptide (TPR) repeat protein